MADDPAHFMAIWNYSDPVGSEARFRAALAQTDVPVLRAQIETQIARAQGLQRRFDDAHATLDALEASLDGLPDVVRVRFLLERGRAWRSALKIDKARPLFLEALAVAEGCGEDGLAVDAAHMMAIVEQDDVSVDWNLKAIAMAEASEQPAARKWLGSLTNNLGWDLHGMGRFEDALAMFEKALVLRRDAGVEKPILIARWCVGRCLRSLERYDDALLLQQELHEACKNRGEPDGYVIEELAELFLIKGDAARAAEYFGEAHAVLSKDVWLVANEPMRLARLLELAGKS